MKGVTLIAMLLSLLFLIGVSFISAGIIIYTYQIKSFFGETKQITLTVKGINLPVAYQSILNLGLQTNYNKDYKFSEIATYASIQKINCSENNDKIKIGTSEITCSTFGRELKNKISSWLSNLYFIIAWESPDGIVKIAENSQTKYSKYKIYEVKYITLPNPEYKIIMYIIEPGE